MNDESSKFHLAYLRFELKYFEKVMMRREVLKPSKVDFVDTEDQEMAAEDA